MKCAIKLPNRTSDRKYIMYCDKCWYETTSNDTKFFSLEEAMEITEQMKKHYQYKFILELEDGTSILIPEPKVAVATDVLEENIFA